MSNSTIFFSILFTLFYKVIVLLVILRHFDFIKKTRQVHKNMKQKDVADLFDATRDYNELTQFETPTGKAVCYELRQWRTSIGGGTLTRSVTVHFDEDKKVTKVETKNCHISPISFWLVLQHLGIIGMIWGMFFGLL